MVDEKSPILVTSMKLGPAADNLMWLKGKNQLVGLLLPGVVSIEDVATFAVFLLAW